MLTYQDGGEEKIQQDINDLLCMDGRTPAEMSSTTTPSSHRGGASSHSKREYKHNDGRTSDTVDNGAEFKMNPAWVPCGTVTREECKSKCANLDGCHEISMKQKGGLVQCYVRGHYDLKRCEPAFLQ